MVEFIKFVKEFYDKIGLGEKYGYWESSYDTIIRRNEKFTYVSFVGTGPFSNAAAMEAFWIRCFSRRPEWESARVPYIENTSTLWPLYGAFNTTGERIDCEEDVTVGV